MTTMLLALGVVTVGVAAPASALQNTITAAATCAADYTSQITWSVSNSESDKTETITASSDTTLVPLGTTVAAGETKKFIETVVTPTAKALTLDATWANGVPSHDTGFITEGQFTSACVAPQIKSTALYLYEKLNPAKDAAWENSGPQRMIITWDGWSYKTAYPGTLPSDVCGPGWGVQQDQINGAQSLFPTTVQYPDIGLFDAGVFHDARHDNLSSLVKVPDCASTPHAMAAADPTSQTGPDDPNAVTGSNSALAVTGPDDPNTVTGSNSALAVTGPDDPNAVTGSNSALAVTGSDGTLTRGLLVGLILVLFGGGVITVSRLRKRRS